IAPAGSEVYHAALAGSSFHRPYANRQRRYRLLSDPDWPSRRGGHPSCRVTTVLEDGRADWTVGQRLRTRFRHTRLRFNRRALHLRPTSKRKETPRLEVFDRSGTARSWLW